MSNFSLNEFVAGVKSRSQISYGNPIRENPILLLAFAFVSAGLGNYFVVSDGVEIIFSGILGIAEFRKRFPATRTAICNPANIIRQLFFDYALCLIPTSSISHTVESVEHDLCIKGRMIPGIYSENPGMIGHDVLLLQLQNDPGIALVDQKGRMLHIKNLVDDKNLLMIRSHYNLIIMSDDSLSANPGRTVKLSPNFNSPGDILEFWKFLQNPSIVLSSDIPLTESVKINPDRMILAADAVKIMKLASLAFGSELTTYECLNILGVNDDNEMVRVPDDIPFELNRPEGRVAGAIVSLLLDNENHQLPIRTLLQDVNRMFNVNFGIDELTLMLEDISGITIYNGIVKFWIR